jgi:hypothetical protein
MVAPVTGPFRSTTILKGPPNANGVGFDWTYIDRIWSRQRRPYNLALDYQLTKQLVLDWHNPGNGNQLLMASCYDAGNFFGSLYNDTYNDVYKKFVAQLGDSSQWGVNLAEYGQSISMIVKRATQLRRFTKKLNHFDFPGAANELGLGSVPKGVRRKSKALADNWLEYHFGWEPLVKDIGSAIDVLQRPPPKKKKVVAKSQRVFPNVDHPSGSSPVWTEEVYTMKVRLSADISVSNPNLYMANQLGFVNPLSIAWELVPFSFVVDWFGNVGDVLSSMTDFLGLDVSSAQVTYLQDHKRHRWSPYTLGFDGNPAPWSANYRNIRCKRSTSSVVPGPTLSIKPFRGFSPARGATAISLLLQQMRGK